MPASKIPIVAFKTNDFIIYSEYALEEQINIFKNSDDKFLPAVDSSNMYNKPQI